MAEHWISARLSTRRSNECFRVWTLDFPIGKTQQIEACSTVYQHDYPKDCHRHREPDGRFILSILPVQQPRKSFRRCQSGRKPRPECGDLRCIFYKCGAVERLEFGLLAPNYSGIKDREIGGKQQRGNPRVARHRKSCGKKHASQIQRVPSESIRSRSRQLFVLAEMSRGISAQEQSQNCNSRSAEQPLHLWPRKPECRDADRVSRTDTPPGPKICRGAQAGAFRSAPVAASTSSTVIRSIAAEYSVRRL
jgi:hypothetical protein